MFRYAVGVFIKVCVLILILSISLYYASHETDAGTTSLYANSTTDSHLDRLSIQGSLDCQHDHFVLRAKSLVDQRLVLVVTNGYIKTVDRTFAFATKGDWLTIKSPSVEAGAPAHFTLTAGENTLLAMVIANRAACVS